MSVTVKDVTTINVVVVKKNATFKEMAADNGRDIVAGLWHVEGVVSVRDRLTYPAVVHAAIHGSPL